VLIHQQGRIMTEVKRLSNTKVILYLVFSWGITFLALHKFYSYFSMWQSGLDIEFNGKLELLNLLPDEGKVIAFGLMTCVCIWFAIFVSKVIYVRNFST
jgi:hypothetical protein